MKAIIIGLVLLAMIISATDRAVFADHISTTIMMPLGLDRDCVDDNRCFIPPEVTIDTGSEITWENKDTTTYNVNVGQLHSSGPAGFDSGLIGAGASFVHTFDIPGTYDYISTIYPWMIGRIHVVDMLDNNPPIVQNITLVVVPGQSVSRDIAGEINDTDDGPLNVYIGDYGAKGSVSISGMVITYKASPRISGHDNFTYVVVDSGGLTATGTATVSILPNINATAAKVVIPAGSGSQDCAEDSLCFMPDKVTVDAGNEVMWINEGGPYHIIDAGQLYPTPAEFHSGFLGAGESFIHQFDIPGTYEYTCLLHSWMRGTVHVQGRVPDPDSIQWGSIVHSRDAGPYIIDLFTGAPTAGEQFEIVFQMIDGFTLNHIEHVNYDITVTQNGKGILADIDAHTRTGEAAYITTPLDSSDPLDVKITLQGIGFGPIYDRTGPIGTEAIFSSVRNHLPRTPDIQIATSQEDPIFIMLESYDPDGGNVAITSITGATKGNIDTSSISTGRILYTPAVNQSGIDTVRYTAEDNEGGTSTGIITIYINEHGNAPPVLNIGNMNASVGGRLNFTATATDANGDSLNFSLTRAPAGATMTEQGEFVWTPTASQHGVRRITITVHDNRGGADWQNIAIKVRPKETATQNPVAVDIADPDDHSTVIAPISDTEIGRILEAYMLRELVVFAGIFPVSGNGTHAIPAGATGPASPAPGFAGFLHAGIIINVTDADRLGTEIANYTLSDVAGQNDTATLSVFINEIGNVPPVLSQISDYGVNAQETLAFKASAVDFGDDMVSYRLSDAPNSAKISRQGSFSWTPGSDDVGNHAFTIAAYDGHGATDAESVTVRVLPAGTANRPPTAPNMTATVTRGDLVTIMPAITDPDGDRVNIIGASGDAGGLVAFLANSIEYYADSNAAAETITYAVADARNAVSISTITIIIQ